MDRYVLLLTMVGVLMVNNQLVHGKHRPKSSNKLKVRMVHEHSNSVKRDLSEKYSDDPHHLVRRNLDAVRQLEQFMNGSLTTPLVGIVPGLVKATVNLNTTLNQTESSSVVKKDSFVNTTIIPVVVDRTITSQNSSKDKNETVTKVEIVENDKNVTSSLKQVQQLDINKRAINLDEILIDETRPLEENSNLTDKLEKLEKNLTINETSSDIEQNPVRKQIIPEISFNKSVNQTIDRKISSVEPVVNEMRLKITNNETNVTLDEQRKPISEAKDKNTPSLTPMKNDNITAEEHNKMSALELITKAQNNNLPKTDELDRLEKQLPINETGSNHEYNSVKKLNKTEVINNKTEEQNIERKARPVELIVNNTQLHFKRTNNDTFDTLDKQKTPLSESEHMSTLSILTIKEGNAQKELNKPSVMELVSKTGVTSFSDKSKIYEAAKMEKLEKNLSIEKKEQIPTTEHFEQTIVRNLHSIEPIVNDTGLNLKIKNETFDTLDKQKTPLSQSEDMSTLSILTIKEGNAQKELNKPSLVEIVSKSDMTSFSDNSKLSETAKMEKIEKNLSIETKGQIPVTKHFEQTIDRNLHSIEPIVNDTRLNFKIKNETFDTLDKQKTPLSESEDNSTISILTLKEGNAQKEVNKPYVVELVTKTDMTSFSDNSKLSETAKMEKIEKNLSIDKKEQTPVTTHFDQTIDRNLHSIEPIVNDTGLNLKIKNETFDTLDKQKTPISESENNSTLPILTIKEGGAQKELNTTSVVELVSKTDMTSFSDNSKLSENAMMEKIEKNLSIETKGQIPVTKHFEQTINRNLHSIEPILNDTGLNLKIKNDTFDTLDKQKTPVSESEDNDTLLILTINDGNAQKELNKTSVVELVSKTDVTSFSDNSKLSQAVKMEKLEKNLPIEKKEQIRPTEHFEQTIVRNLHSIEPIVNDTGLNLKIRNESFDTLDKQKTPVSESEDRFTLSILTIKEGNAQKELNKPSVVEVVSKPDMSSSLDNSKLPQSDKLEKLDEYLLSDKPGISFAPKENNAEITVNEIGEETIDRKLRSVELAVNKTGSNSKITEKERNDIIGEQKTLPSLANDNIPPMKKDNKKTEVGKPSEMAIISKADMTFLENSNLPLTAKLEMPEKTMLIDEMKNNTEENAVENKNKTEINLTNFRKQTIDRKLQSIEPIASVMRLNLKTKNEPNDTIDEKKKPQSGSNDSILATKKGNIKTELGEHTEMELISKADMTTTFIENSNLPQTAKLEMPEKKILIDEMKNNTGENAVENKNKTEINLTKIGEQTIDRKLQSLEHIANIMRLNLKTKTEPNYTLDEQKEPPSGSNDSILAMRKDNTKTELDKSSVVELTSKADVTSIVESSNSSQTAKLEKSVKNIFTNDTGSRIEKNPAKEENKTEINSIKTFKETIETKMRSIEPTVENTGVNLEMQKNETNNILKEKRIPISETNEKYISSFLPIMKNNITEKEIKKQFVEGFISKSNMSKAFVEISNLSQNNDLKTFEHNLTKDVANSDVEQNSTRKENNTEINSNKSVEKITDRKIETIANDNGLVLKTKNDKNGTLDELRQSFNGSNNNNTQTEINKPSLVELISKANTSKSVVENSNSPQPAKLETFKKLLTKDEAKSDVEQNPITKQNNTVINGNKSVEQITVRKLRSIETIANDTGLGLKTKNDTLDEQRKSFSGSNDNNTQKGINKSSLVELISKENTSKTLVENSNSSKAEKVETFEQHLTKDEAKISDEPNPIIKQNNTENESNKKIEQITDRKLRPIQTIANDTGLGLKTKNETNGTLDEQRKSFSGSNDNDTKMENNQSPLVEFISKANTSKSFVENSNSSQAEKLKTFEQNLTKNEENSDVEQNPTIKQNNTEIKSNKSDGQITDRNLRQIQTIANDTGLDLKTENKTNGTLDEQRKSFSGSNGNDTKMEINQSPLVEFISKANTSKTVVVNSNSSQAAKLETFEQHLTKDEAKIDVEQNPVTKQNNTEKNGSISVEQITDRKLRSIETIASDTGLGLKTKNETNGTINEQIKSFSGSNDKNTQIGNIKSSKVANTSKTVVENSNSSQAGKLDKLNKNVTINETVSYIDQNPVTKLYTSEKSVGKITEQIFDMNPRLIEPIVNDTGLHEKITKNEPNRTQDEQKKFPTGSSDKFTPPLTLVKQDDIRSEPIKRSIHFIPKADITKPFVDNSNLSLIAKLNKLEKNISNEPGSNIEQNPLTKLNKGKDINNLGIQNKTDYIKDPVLDLISKAILRQMSSDEAKVENKTVEVKHSTLLKKPNETVIPRFDGISSVKNDNIDDKLVKTSGELKRPETFISSLNTDIKGVKENNNSRFNRTDDKKSTTQIMNSTALLSDGSNKEEIMVAEETVQESIIRPIKFVNLNEPQEKIFNIEEALRYRIMFSELLDFFDRVLHPIRKSTRFEKENLKQIMDDRILNNELDSKINSEDDNVREMPLLLKKMLLRIDERNQNETARETFVGEDLPLNFRRFYNFKTQEPLDNSKTQEGLDNKNVTDFNSLLHQGNVSEIENDKEGLKPFRQTFLNGKKKMVDVPKSYPQNFNFSKIFDRVNNTDNNTNIDMVTLPTIILKLTRIVIVDSDALESDDDTVLTETKKLENSSKLIPETNTTNLSSQIQNQAVDGVETIEKTLINPERRNTTEHSVQVESGDIISQQKSTDINAHKDAIIKNTPIIMYKEENNKVGTTKIPSPELQINKTKINLNSELAHSVNLADLIIGGSNKTST